MSHSFAADGTEKIDAGGQDNPEWLFAGEISSLYPPSSIGVAVECVSPGSSATLWPAANRAIFIPFRLEETTPITQLACFNGGVVAGNTDLGIYNESKILVEAHSTFSGTVAPAMAGANVWQVYDIDDIAATPGLYYLAMSHSEATATFFRTALGPTVLHSCGAFQMTGAYPLPAVAVFETPVSSFAPAVKASPDLVI